MGFVGRTLKFGGGLVLGAAVSTAVSVLLAPQSGLELRAEMSDLAEQARRAGEEAEILETELLKRKYRVAVNDPTALTGKFDQPGAPTQISAGSATTPVRTEAAEARQKAREAEKEAEQARKAAQQADAEERKADQKAAEAERKANEAEAKARQARLDAEKQTASRS